MTLQLNRADIAESEIFENSKVSLNEINQVDSIMEKAFVENNVEFAKLLIKNNFQIDKFLSYNSELFYAHSKLKDNDCFFNLYN